MKSPSFGGEIWTNRIDACLQMCSDIRSIRKVHACILTSGFGIRIPLVSRLLNRYANVGSLSESRYVFDRIISRDNSLWNSAMVGYFRAGEFGEVYWLYSNLKLRGIGVDSASITFGLKSCVELCDVVSGRRIHVDAYKSHLNASKFVGSSLVGLYSGYGNIVDAQRAFEEIMDKDIVAYTAMITSYARFSDTRAIMACEIARDMMRKKLGVNRVTLVSLLQAAGQLEALKEGRSIHSYALRRGIDLSNEIFETSLVDMYSKCGAANEAASLLRQSERVTVPSWNAMIGGLVHRGHSYEALRAFSLMEQEAKASPDLVTIANVLAACSDLNCDYGVISIHGYLIRRELPLDLVAATVLIDAYSRSGKMNYARELFDRLMVRDTILNNVMISGYVQNGKVDNAMEIFINMVKGGVRPNSSTVLSLMSSFAELSNTSKGRWIHGFVIRTGLVSDINVSNQILHMYAKCGRLDLARKIIDSMIEKDLVSWTAMMMGYVECGHADEALALFQLMQAGTMERPDSLALITVLQALSQLGCLKHVKEIHGYIYRIWSASDTDTNNALIIAYSKCGKLHSAKEVFHRMAERSLFSWNSMLAAYGMHGYCREMLEVFNQMQRQNMKPDEVTFTSLFSACGHAGLVEVAWQIFRSMDSVYSVSPQEEHYGCMVDLLGRAGQLEEAYELVKGSPLRDRSALCALLASCRVYGNTELGELIGRELLDLEPLNSCNYALVSSIYAQSSRWSEAAELRIHARERGLRKVPGYSIIEAGVND